MKLTGHQAISKVKLLIMIFIYFPVILRISQVTKKIRQCDKFR